MLTYLEELQNMLKPSQPKKRFSPSKIKKKNVNFSVLNSMVQVLGDDNANIHFKDI